MRRLTKLSALFLIAAGLAAGQASAAPSGSDWPQFRGPTANGISPEKGINKDWAAKPPKLLWKVDMTDGGYSGPAVANGILYIIDHSGDEDVVRALSMADGSEVWSYRYTEAKPMDHGFTRSTPTVKGGRVYTMSRLGLACCFEAKTGKVVWTRNLSSDFGSRRPGWDYACSPVLDGKRLILCPGGDNAGIVALDKDTGATIWQGGGSVVSGYSTPVIAKIDGVRQYVFFTQRTVTGAADDDGKPLWSAPWRTGADVNAANPVVMGDTVYITSGYQHGCELLRIDASGATTVWQNKAMQAHFNTPLLLGGLLYGTGDPGFLMCLDPKTGEVKWKQPGFEKGGCVAVDGTIIALGGSNGDLYMAAIDPSAYKELGHIAGPLGGQSWTPPIVAEGKLIIRNTKAIACLELK
jgi:outer membrane protein assembly factor BamB